MSSALIVDDHPIVLQGCRRVLEDAGVEVVYDARDPDAGYDLYDRHRPDVVIVDLAMGGSGLEGLLLVQRIRSHDLLTGILVLSMHSDPIIVACALDAGANGYVIKDTSSEELVKAFEQVHAGSTYLSKDLSTAIERAGTGGDRNVLASFTPRELQTLALLAKGNAYGEIAEQLGVSYKTVVNVSYQLKQKLNARNLPELIRAAVQVLMTMP